MIADIPGPTMRARIDRLLRSSNLLLRLVIARFAEDRCLQVAGNLTFTTLLALVPLFTVAFTVFAAFPVFEDWSNAFKIFLLTTLVPEMGGKVITVYMQQFADNAAKLTALGLAFLALTALMLMAEIERVFNSIWRAGRPRSALQRFVIYWAVVTIGPLLLGASLSLTSWLVTQSMGLTGDSGPTHAFALRALSVLLNAAAFSALYLLIPNRKVNVADAVAGGTAAAVMFELMKLGFGLYVQLFPTYSLIYGTFATVPIFLLWIYLSWLVILFGAVVVAVLPRWRLGARLDSTDPRASLLSALGLLESMHSAHLHAETRSVPDLSRFAGIAEDETERLLERMERLRWVRRIQPAAWVLARDLGTLRLGDVYRAFVAGEDADDAHASILVRAAARHLAQVEQRLDISLRELLAKDRDDSSEQSDEEQAPQP